jgi:hypothetical protein
LLASYLNKNDHFLPILGPKHDFLKRIIKRRILTLFLGFFGPDFTSKKFENNIFRLKSKRAIGWCMNCLLNKKKLLSLLIFVKN